MQLTLKTERKPAINQEQFDKKHGYRRVKKKAKILNSFNIVVQS